MTDRPRARLLAPLLFFAALLTLAALMTHRSVTPTVLERWSLPYAYLLMLAALLTLALGAFSVPAWRAYLMRPAQPQLSRRQAWLLLAGVLLSLPVAALVLYALLPVAESSLMRALFMLTLTGLTLPPLWFLHRSGAGDQTLQLPRPGPLLLLLFCGQLLLTLLLHGQLPELKPEGEIWFMGSALRQYHDLRNFISLSPDRNAQTWFHFFAIWPLSGAFLHLVGPGLLQARFFYLLTGWLALPFLYLAARRRYGQTAALLTVALAGQVPLHYNWAFTHIWVPVATSIALAAFILARSPQARRPLLLRLGCGFFAVSAVDGHPYGGAFALMFCLLHLAEFLRGRPPDRHRAFAAFVAGCAGYTVLWAGYHIALPGLALADIPRLLQLTWDWESGIGQREFGVGLTPGNILNTAKLYLYHLPHEFLLALLMPLTALRRRRPAERSLLVLLAGSVLLIALLLGHVNEFYFVFLFPFTSLWFGAWLGGMQRAPVADDLQGRPQLSFMAAGILGAVLTLYAIQALAMANYDGALRKQAQLQIMSAAGRAFDRLLPPEDIVVAGQEGYYLGMPQRLNYGSSFSFTWGQAEYWPLAEPQAIIVTPGLDADYSGLDRWLIDRDFRPARCISVPDVGDGVAILYLAPARMPPERAVDCEPDVLAWLAAAA